MSNLSGDISWALGNDIGLPLLNILSSALVTLAEYIQLCSNSYIPFLVFLTYMAVSSCLRIEQGA